MCLRTQGFDKGVSAVVSQYWSQLVGLRLALVRHHTHAHSAPLEKKKPWNHSTQSAHLLQSINYVRAIESILKGAFW